MLKEFGLQHRRGRSGIQADFSLERESSRQFFINTFSCISKPLANKGYPFFCFDFLKQNDIIHKGIKLCWVIEIMATAEVWLLEFLHF